MWFAEMWHGGMVAYTKTYPIKSNRHLPLEKNPTEATLEERPRNKSKQKPEENRGKDDTVSRMTCKVQLLEVACH